MPDTPGLDTRRLHETCDSVLVTRAAARVWLDHVGSEGEESAVRELLACVLDARQTHPASHGRPEQWRRRDRSAGVDLEVQVAREGRLAVVTWARARGYSGGRRGRRRG